ncbi:MAG TPA: T9SS type A sorting domain-containing protein [Candidatus Kapabacteria bacterium]|nr:T9SS type A sorting domain-containing protein [Candidatus Kapabacteria bacterium]
MNRTFIVVLLLSFLFFASIHAQPYTGGQTDQQITQQPVQTDTTSGWQVVFSNPIYGSGGSYIDQLQFPSKDTGYATAANGSFTVLLRSTDMGKTWDTLATPVPGYPTKFVTSLIGFSVYVPGGVNGAVYKTTDGGMSWQSIPKPGGNGHIAFANPDTCLIIDGPDIERTIDGGKSWNVSSGIQTGVAANDASFGDTVTCYAVGEPVSYPPHLDWPPAGLCAKTTNAGASWTMMYSGVPTILSCCQALDANTLFVGALSAYVAKTTDGGVKWDTMSIIGSEGGFLAISFANKRHGFLVGGDVINNVYFGVIYSTSDSGKSWQKQYIRSAPELYGVQMLNDSIAVVCGGGNIYRTTTGGTFSSVSQPQSPNFQVQVFPDPTPGMVTIQYQLPSTTTVSFTFTDVLGTVVGSIPSQLQNTGAHQITFDGSTLTNGVYYFQLNTQIGSYTGRFTVRK